MPEESRRMFDGLHSQDFAKSQGCMLLRCAKGLKPSDFEGFDAGHLDTLFTFG